MMAVTNHPAALQRNSEWELVLLCVRSHRVDTQRERVRSILGTHLNWTQIALTISEHCVAPSFYAGLVADGRDLVPVFQEKQFREIAQASAKTSLLLLRELLCLYELFEAANIPVIPYKGAILAKLAYGNFTQREFGDLDFAIEQRYIPQATALLFDAGFSAGFDQSEAHAGQEDIAPGQYSFVSRHNRVLVELHTERTLRYFPSPLNFSALNRRLMHVEVGGRDLRTFSVEDTLIMLCVHGAKHFWDRLGWIVDIAALIEAQPVQWGETLRVAAEMKSIRLLLLGVYLAHSLLEAPLPPDILQRAQDDKSVQWLARKVGEQYRVVSIPTIGVVPRAFFRLRSRDSLWEGLRHTLRLTMRPTESDRQTIRLPRFLYPLYMVVRPWRLLRDYGLGLKRKLRS